MVAIVDRNTLQITGKTEEVCALEPLEDKFTAFGWSVRSVDGHNVTSLIETLHQIPFKKGKPSLLIAHTIKGKGVSFMEDAAGWHHRVPNDEEFEKAIRELDEEQARLEG